MIRQFEYLTALAHERHFARAAAKCHVTQSTLSAGIKHLEESLGVLIVERNQRFAGFTPEGERVLFWAKHFLADYSILRQELGQMDGNLTGTVTLGVVPMAESVVPLLTADFTERHPRVRLVVRSLSSMEIERALCDFTLDVGLTYLEHPPSPSLHSLPVYRERYILVTGKSGSLRGRRTVRWAEAAKLPLCLLTPDMENRRIIDHHFRSVGVEVCPSLETNSLNTLWFHLHQGSWSSVLPHTFMPLLVDDKKVMSLPLVEPEVSSLVGLVAANRDPVAPAVKVLLAIAGSLSFRKRLETASRDIPRPT
jgi:DNA-binding transcriptional LysR family regulator